MLKMKIEKLNVDEVIKRKGDVGSNTDDILKQIDKVQDDRFTDFYSLRFGWKEQKNDNNDDIVKKLISALPNGKICFLDRSQEEKDIIPEDPYLCLVYDRPGSVAFAKILFPETQPRIYIPATRTPVVVFKNKDGITERYPAKGETYEARIVDAINKMEISGFDTFKVIFRRNIREKL
jgi:hypothetical protein